MTLLSMDDLENTSAVLQEYRSYPYTRYPDFIYYIFLKEQTINKGALTDLCLKKDINEYSVEELNRVLLSFFS